MTARATLGGVPLLASSPVRWSLREGVDPVVETFDVQPTDVAALLTGAPQGLRLEVADASAPTLTVERLFAVYESPHDDPNLGRVAVADVRWWWPYQHVTRRYNVRRRVGVRRLANPGTPELQPVVDRVWYAPWSLRGGDAAGGKWTARDVLEDVLKEVASSVPGGAAYDIGDVGAEIPIENLEIDDSADQALARVLAYLPEAAVSVTRQGTIRVYSRASGAESTVVRDAGPEVVGGGHITAVRMARTRPSAIHVLFGREVEVRFDGAENSSKSSTSARGEDDRFMENVAPVPDWQLDLPSGVTASQGTWVTLDELLLAWGSVPGFGALDFSDLRRLFSPFMDAWAPLQLAGEHSPDADWSSRIACLQQHWRRTWRINRRWMDRILSLRAWRVATIDPTTGTRGPAAAWCDYTYLGTQRSMLSESTAGKDQSYAINVQGWPAGGRLTSAARPAPARVVILDHDQGIIHLDFLADPSRMFQSPLPGQIELEGDNTAAGSAPGNPGPAGRIGDQSRTISFNAVADGMRAPMLTGQFRVAVIVSATPGSPNDDRQFTRLVRRADDPNVRRLLPPFAQGGLSDCRGPIMEVRVGAGLETARVAWSDDFGSLIEAAFGIGGQGSVDLTSLTVNRSADGQGGSLDAIADAVAARVYAGFADHGEGSATFRMAPSIEPIGRLGEVVHQLAIDGAAQTVLSLPARQPRLNVFALLPDSTRRMVMRLADPGRV